MASATVIKFPDGRTESKNILSSFERNATNVVLFETDKVDNGHKVVEVSYLEDGMYRNVIDSNKWSEVKQDLVDILHDRIQNEEYRIVPSEILVTEDPYRQLALRDENYEKIATSYANYVNTMVNDTVVKEEVPVESPTEELTSQIDEMVNAVDMNEQVNINLNEPVQEIVAAPVNASIVSQTEAPILMNEPIKEEGISEVTPVPEMIQTEPVIEVHEDIPQSEVINPFGSFAPEVSTEEIVADTMPSQGIVNEAPVLDIQSPVVPAAEMESSISEMPIMDQPEVSVLTNEAPQTDVISDITSMPEMAQPEISGFTINPEPIVAPVGIVDAPISVGGVDNFINIPSAPQSVVTEAPVLDVQPAVMPAAEGSQVTESAVDNTYMSSVDSIIAEMKTKTEEYTNTIQKLQESYINEMELMKNEISNKLQEARGINELSKQTFDKAQAMNNVEMIDSGMELKRVA